MTYWVFDTDGQYDQGSLDGHLDYLRKWVGSPQGERFGFLTDAVEMAQAWADEGSPQVITDADFKTLETVSKREVA